MRFVLRPGIRLWPIALSTMLLLAGPALAEQPSQAQKAAIRQACSADYQAHCASVPTGGAAALSCLQQNMTSLAAPCRQAVAAVGGAAASAPATGAPSAPPAAATPVSPTAPRVSARQEAMLLRQSCGVDFRRYCSGVPFGGGRVIACLEGNADRLSPGCGSALQALRESR
jgi:hypothetical protein